MKFAVFEGLYLRYVDVFLLKYDSRFFGILYLLSVV